MSPEEIWRRHGGRIKAAVDMAMAFDEKMPEKKKVCGGGRKCGCSKPPK